MRLLPLADAREVVCGLARGQDAQSCALRDAVGRVLAVDLFSPVALPPWTHSAMDGYAVRAQDVKPGGTLRLNEVVTAGTAPTMEVGPGTASAVMTGAMIPSGADAVLVIEDTDGSLSGVVSLGEHATAGPHIRAQGEELAQGEKIGSCGQVVSPGDVALWAAVGLEVVMVSSRPRVGLVVTGDELVAPGRPLQPGQIYGSNALTLSTWLPLSGAHCVATRRVGDRREALEAVLDEVGSASDLVVTTGGASMGVRDLLQDVVRDSGGRVLFWKVAMKPGKPVLVGVLACGTPWIGLPGNPVSCAVGYLQFVHAWVRRSLGATGPSVETIEAYTTQPLPARPDRDHLVRVKMGAREGRLTCSLSGRQGSASIPSLRVADGLVVVPPGGLGIEEGRLVEVQLFPGARAGAWCGSGG